MRFLLFVFQCNTIHILLIKGKQFNIRIAVVLRLVVIILATYFVLGYLFWPWTFILTSKLTYSHPLEPKVQIPSTYNSTMYWLDRLYTKLQIVIKSPVLGQHGGLHQLDYCIQSAKFKKVISANLCPCTRRRSNLVFSYITRDFTESWHYSIVFDFYLLSIPSYLYCDSVVKFVKVSLWGFYNTYPTTAINTTGIVDVVLIFYGM